MHHIRILVAAAALAGASLACSVNFGGPTLKTGPTETLTINESLPKNVDEVALTINMAAGQLDLSGGADGVLVGEIRDNVDEWVPAVTNDGDSLVVDQGAPDTGSGFNLDNSIVNDWTLQLGDIPYDLTLNAGAYKGTLDLSGVPLRRLTINDGASQSDVKFDSVNPEEMDTLTYKTGASQVTLSGLGNANAEEMDFDGGAGDYELDFSGELQRDLHVKVTAGVGSLEIIVPAGARVSVDVTGGLNDVNTSGTWDKEGNTYTSLGTDGPSITIEVDMGVGSLTLTQK
jgi:hypothetical protein